MGCCCNKGIVLDVPMDSPVIECISRRIEYDKTLTSGQSYTIEATGYWLIKLAATGHQFTADKWFNHGIGEETGIIYAKKGTVVPFKLGTTPSFNFGGLEINIPEVSDKTLNGSAITFTYLGIPNTAAGIRPFGGLGASGNVPAVNKILGDAADSVVLTTLSRITKWSSDELLDFWATAEIDFPEDGEYVIATTADDLAVIYLDEEAVFYYSNLHNIRLLGDPNNPAIQSSELTYYSIKIKVKAGKHRMWVYNINTICCHHYNYLGVKAPNGDLLALPSSGKWLYVQTTPGCAGA